MTGACVVALGHHVSGMMGNDDKLAEKVKAADEATAERVWPLPLWDEYRRQIRSDYADMKNTGGRAGGAITGAALLEEFTEDYPWVHLDIAGTAWSSRTRPYIPKGGVGIGVRLLTHLARHWKKEDITDTPPVCTTSASAVQRSPRDIHAWSHSNPSAGV